MPDPRFLQLRRLDGLGAGPSLPANDDSRLETGDGILWVHFEISNEDARAWLDKQDDISPPIQEALTTIEARPRAFSDKKGLFVILRGVNTNPGDDPEDMVAIRLWIEEHRIVSSRRRRLLAVLDIADELENGLGPTTSGDFLATLVEKLADRIGIYVDGIEDRIGEAEESLMTSDASEFRQRLGTLRRQIATVRRFLAPQRDALDRLYRQPVSWMGDSESNRVREEADRFTRYLEDLDLARERAIVLQEEFLNQQAQQQNARMYVLSVIAAIFLPLTFVTGLLGMNVGGLPGLETPNGFPISVVVMLVSVGGLIMFLRLKKWI